uniref:Uncharacterized protein n=1 Tax=Amphimedon queenslandica TaxID=400682 RepID=A0A1X7VC93_AMPQE
MEDFIDKNRSNARAYYIRQCNRVKSKARIANKISNKYKIASAKAYSKQFHALNPGYILQKCKNWYNKNKDSKILKSTCYSKTNYFINPDHKKEASRKHYQKNPQPKKEASRDQYHKNPQPKKEASRDQYQKNPQPKKEASRDQYQKNPQPKKEASRDQYQKNPQPKKEASRDQYQKNPNSQKRKSKERYQQNPDPQRQKSLKRYYENRDAILSATKDKFLRYKFSDNKMDKLKMALNKENKKRLNKDYYERNYSHILYRLRSNYSLPAPNSEAKEYYFMKIMEALYYSPEIVDDLLPSRMKGVDFENISYDSKCNSASSILLESVLKNRSHKVGVLIRAAKSIKKMKLNSFSDFGEQCHTKNSEPYFYESAYLYPNDDFDSQLDSPIAIPVDANGICYVAGVVDVSCIDRVEEFNDDSD